MKRQIYKDRDRDRYKDEYCVWVGKEIPVAQQEAAATKEVSLLGKRVVVLGLHIYRSALTQTYMYYY